MSTISKTKTWKRAVVSVVFLIGLLPFVHAQSVQPLDSIRAAGCQRFRNGTFKIPADSLLPETIIVRNGAKQIEMAEKKTSAESVVKWIDDCTYVLTPTDRTIALVPGLPKGCFLTVKIIETKDDYLIQESKWNFYREVFTTKVFKIKDQ